MRTTQYSDPVEAKLERLGLDVQYEPEAARFDAAEGLYWFCSGNYAGQGDPLYSILSRLGYKPGALSRGPDSESAAMVYDALADEDLDPQELFAWIEGRRSNPSRGARPRSLAPRLGHARKRPCALCGVPTYVTVDGEPRCPGCTVSTSEDAARQALARNRSRLRENPTKHAKAVGKRLAVGDASVMAVANDDGTFSVVVVRGEDAQTDGPYATKADALKAATLTYETLKHQGRLNPRGRRR